MAKNKAHIRYTWNGIPVPGVTTVIGILAKPALVPWANRLGLQGIEVGKYVDDKAAIGSLAHEMILAHFRQEKTDTTDYSKNQIDQAENSLLSFFEWIKDKDIRPELVEAPLVSQRFGGTVDFYGLVNGTRTLIDFKTGKGVFPEMLIQLAAYKSLLEINGHSVQAARIVRVGRTEDEGFEDRQANGMETRYQIFQACLNIYELQKELKKEG